MVVGVADTHVVIWYLYNDSRLSFNARTFMENAANTGDQIGISSISLVEIIYLIEKGKIPAESLTKLARELDDSISVLTEIPLNLSIARSLSHVSGVQVPDMPDRIIAATALYLNVPVISRDAKIQISDIRTIW